MAASDADINRVDRVVARAVAPPEQVVGVFDRTISPEEEEIEILLDVDLSAVKGALRVEVDLWAAGLVVYSGRSSGVVDADQPNSWEITLEPAVPVLEVSRTRLDVRVAQGDDADGQIVTVANGGPGALVWSAGSNESWLRLASGRAEVEGGGGTNTARGTGRGVERGAQDILTVLPATAGLPEGEHVGVVLVSAPGALAAPTEIEVRVRVDPADRRTLRVRGDGRGAGRISSSPNGIQCTVRDGKASGRCEADFAPGQVIDLFADPQGGHSFSGWSGGCEGAGACRVRLAGDETVAAAFSEDTGVPEVAVSPSALRMTTVAGSRLETLESSLLVTNTGNLGARIKVSTDVDWLTVGGVGGTLDVGESARLEIKVRTKSLPVGEHRGTVSLAVEGEKNGGSAPTRTIPVSLVIEAAPAAGRLVLGASEIGFQADQGKEPHPPRRSVSLANVGGAPVVWTARAEAEWLEVEDEDGRLEAGGAASIGVRVSGRDLEAGSYETSLVVTWAAPDGSGAATTMIPVRLDVKGTTSWTLSTELVERTVVESSSTEPLGVSVQIANQGTARLRWRAKEGAKWLSLSSRSGFVEPGEVFDLVLLLSPAGLEPGRYQEVVEIRSTGKEGRTLELVVTLLVTPPGS